MSNVIHLDDTQRNRRTKPLLAGATAQIVIFHGVRVQHLTDEMIEQTERRSSRRLHSMDNQATATELS